MNSKKDIYNFLITSLDKIDNKIIKIYDEDWMTISGFRRAFNEHIIFFNLETKEYAFHVTEFDTYHDFPNFGKSKSYNDLIHKVVDKYAILWKIKS